MGKVDGFLEARRHVAKKRPVQERVHDYREITTALPLHELREQAGRCMDCGIPFCHNGCPLGNLIPEWNHLTYSDDWHAAIRRLHLTNNFPEFTGRLCPAPCEPACVLAINDEPVAIKQVELAIIDRAFDEGWVHAEPPAVRTGRRVAVIGSGPAGLAAAQELNRAGHWVTVYERNDRIGGLLRYGIPDFKLEKQVLDRRLSLMTAEGVSFETGKEIGAGVAWDELRSECDAVVVAIGAGRPRDLDVPGRDLDGIHFALDYLTQQNRLVAADIAEDDSQRITAAGKDVVILGGGDTGADCLGNVLREGCASVQQFEVMPRPPDNRDTGNPWPDWPLIFRTSPAHEEGGERDYDIQTTHFTGQDGGVTTLHGKRVPRTEREQDFSTPADIVLIAAGFLGPEACGLLEQIDADLDARGNLIVNDHMETSVKGVFAAGDAHRGASLIVWAIAEGRRAAQGCAAYLT